MPTPLNRPSVELYFGKSGEGKTVLALSDIGPAPAILYDVMRQEKLAHRSVICSTEIELVTALKKGVRRICWRGFQTMGKVQAFEFANRCAIAAGDRVLFWDDVDRYMPVHPVPVYADDIINAGRHRGLTIKASCRRPQNMPRNLTEAATAVSCFRVTGGRALDYLRVEYFEEMASELPAMPRGEGLYWTERNGPIRKKFYRA